MSTFDKKSTALAASLKPASASATSILLFIDVLKAVDDTADVTHGVRQNMRTAVNRTAKLMSPLGLAGQVLIPDIGKRLDKLAPAQLGLKTNGSLSAYKSNLRRALRLVGLTVMPGRHVTPLSAEWQTLFDSLPEIMAGDSLKDNPIRIRLSRFAHVASQHGWLPDAIGPAHLEQFGALLDETCLGSKSTRVVRETGAAWAAARALPGWPQNELGETERSEHGYSLSWSDFPDSFRADVESFVSRDDLDGTDVDDADGQMLRPLRESTADNYRQTCLRAASILVRLGDTAESLTTLKDLVSLHNVKRISGFLAEKNQRTEGGAPFQTALILFIAAKHHVHLSEADLKKLERFWKKMRGRYGEMSTRTFKRLQQFDEPRALKAMAQLPTTLLKAAKAMGQPTVKSAKLVRSALLLSLAQDTALRAGNLVGINVNQHLSLQHRQGWPPVADLVIPASEVKNGIEIQTRLTDDTARLLQLWLDNYRCTQIAINCNWLFPNTTGGHRSVSQALEDVKDLSARYAGLDITPHLMRAFVGKVILDEQPDGHAIVQQMLGHKSLKTTVQYYAPVRPAQARARYHESLSRLRSQP